MRFTAGLHFSLALRHFGRWPFLWKSLFLTALRSWVASVPQCPLEHFPRQLNSCHACKFTAEKIHHSDFGGGSLPSPSDLPSKRLQRGDIEGKDSQMARRKWGANSWWQSFASRHYILISLILSYINDVRLPSQFLLLRNPQPSTSCNSVLCEAASSMHPRIWQDQHFLSPGNVRIRRKVIFWPQQLRKQRNCLCQAAPGFVMHLMTPTLTSTDHWSMDAKTSQKIGQLRCIKNQPSAILRLPRWFYLNTIKAPRIAKCQHENMYSLFLSMWFSTLCPCALLEKNLIIRSMLSFTCL